MGAMPVAVLAAAVLAAAPSGDRRPRPDAPTWPAVVETIPTAIQVYNEYGGLSARSFAGARVVVHWVERGLNAPPLNDDDEDGVPDYVERVAAAGDTALAYFERRGFAGVRPDSGGPDPQPDVYVSRFAAGLFGVALPAAAAEGGAFVAVSNLLDPSDGESLGSLDGTVAHELFHLVQFSYFPPAVEPQLPAWIGEGSAAAMEARVYPRLTDIVWSLQLRHWLASPQSGITRSGYGAALLWRWVDVRLPRLLPELLRRGRPSARTFVARYEGLANRPFAPDFQRFALAAYDTYAALLAPYSRLAVGGRMHAAVAPLAVHYVRLPLARDATLRVECERPCRASVAYERESPYAGRASRLVTVKARRVGEALVFRLRHGPRLTLPTLVLANGSAVQRLRYAVSLTRSRG